MANRIPQGGYFATIDGVMIVAYDVGGGHMVYYDFSEPGTMQQVDPNSLGYAPAQDPSQFYATPGLIHGGTVQELFGIQEPTYADWFNKQLEVATGGASWVNDPEMRGIYTDWVVNPEKSADEIQANVRQTQYWRSRTDNQRTYDNLSPADQASKDAAATAGLAGRYQSIVGTPISITDPQLQSWGHAIASGVESDATILEKYLKPIALQNPESPWSQTVRQTEEAQRQRPVDIANQKQAVQALYDQWGLQGDDATMQSWAQGIVDKTKSQADLQKWVQDQAKSLYPWKDPTVDTYTAAQPWLSTFSQVMERPAKGLFDPTIQQALQTGEPPYQFAQRLKMTDEWLNTTNAKQALNQGMQDAGKTFGFVK